MKAAGDSAFFAAARVACLSDSRRTLARRRSIFALFSATVLRVTLPVSCFLASSRARPIGPNNKHGSARILWNSSRQLAAGSYATAPKTPLPASIFTVVLHNANCSRFMHVRRRQFDAPVPASNSWYAVMLTPSLSLSLSLYPRFFGGEERWSSIFGGECGFPNGCRHLERWLLGRISSCCRATSRGDSLEYFPSFSSFRIGR